MNKAFVSFALIALAAPAFAMPSSENVIVIRKSENTIYEGSSAHNRMDKSVTVAFQTLGFGPGVGNNKGLAAGYFLDRNKLIQVEAMTTDLHRLGLNDGEVKSQSIGVHFKHFTGNSFYYRAGLDHLKVESSKTVYSRITTYPMTGPSYTSSESSGEFSGTMTGATLAIGNQWQWSNFTLGCDWIGATAPLVSNSSGSSTSDSFAQREREKDEEVYLKGTKLHLLRLYLGASF